MTVTSHPSPSRTTTPEALATSLRERVAAGRLIVALAGPPGSGKSTLADALVASLNSDNPGFSAVLPMDGFHYDDLYLVPAGLRPRKGAPETFDVGGLKHMLQRLKDANEDHVAVRLFDRKLEIARAGSRLISRTTRVIVVEGNYLLLKSEPWSELAPYFDVKVLIETPESVLRERLTARWVHFALNPLQIAEKLEENDLPNGRTVVEESIEPDFRLATS